MNQCNEDRELAKQKRALKVSEISKARLTPGGIHEFLILEHNLSAMKRFNKFGIHNFDEQGRIFIEDYISGKQEYESGKTFLEDIIDYFEQKDEAYAYKHCAEAKELLNAYNLKFGD